MSEQDINIKSIIVNVTAENIEQKLEEHNKKVIEAIKFLKLGVIKIHTRVSRPSDREIQIQSMISGY